MIRFHLACALCVVLLHGSSIAQQINRPGQGASANAGAKHIRTEPPNESPASAASAIQSRIERIATPHAAEATGGKSNDEKKREQDDLEAQQDMAFWAKAMFFATLIGAAVSSFATWLLYLTLKQSRRATFAALRAAVAGRQSVRVANNSAEKQLRAYALVKSVIVERRHFGHEVVTVHIHNFGQTPARDLEYWINVNSATRGLIGEVPINATVNSEPNNVGVVGPRDDFHASVSLPEFANGLGIEIGVSALYVSGWLTYNNGFNSGCRTTFKFSRTGEDWRSDGDLEICGDGNTAT